MKTRFKYRAVMFVCFLTLAATLDLPSSEADRDKDLDGVQGDGASKWRAGEVIVRFRDASDPEILKNLSGPELPTQRLSSSLRQLAATNPVATIRPLAHPALKREDSSMRGTYVFRFSDNRMDVKGVSQALSKDENIEYAEPNYLLEPCDIPNDPYFSSSGSWGQPYDDQWGLKAAQVPAAWDVLTNTNEILVAVVDSGVDFTHPELAGRISTNGWNFIDQNADPTDDNGHGTFITGIIAATVNNGLGIAGIAKNAKILPVKVITSTGYIWTDTAASGIDYAANQGARIISLSFSGVGSYTMENAINGAHSRQAVIVTSAGNASSPHLSQPAAYANVITVGASDHEDRLADFSNYGPRIDVVAPGGDSGSSTNGNSILSLRAADTSKGIPLDDYYTRWRGTSFSSPFVAGVVALMRSQRPQLQVEQIRQILRSTADDVMAPGWDWQTSYGRVNALAAVQRSNAIATRIEAPANFDYITGTVAINGSVTGTPFDHFLVEIGIGLVPTTWTLLTSNRLSVSHGSLAIWNTPQPPQSADGVYTIRVTSFDGVGFRYEDRVMVTVNNIEPPSHVGWPQGAGANCTSPVLADLHGDGKMEVLWGQRFSVVVKSHDGKSVWSQPILESPTGPPSVADLDGDGYAEIGIISHDWLANTGQVYLWRTFLNPIPGWPKTFYWRNDFGVDAISPVFADLDAAGFKDIIWCSGTTNDESVINVDRMNGTSLPGWPVTLPKATGRVFSPPAAGDIDGDGFMDLAIMTAFSDEGGGYLYLLHHNGTVFPGFPVSLGADGLGGSPALADVDHDGQLEVFTETYEGLVSLYEPTGQPMPGWPKQIGWFTQSPAFADLDGDGQLEVAVGCGSGLYVFRNDGSLMSGWPQPDGAMAPIIADLDGDGRLDVATAGAAIEDPGYVYAWDASGNGLYHRGFPIKATTDTTYSGPVIADVDGDGWLELAVFGTDNYHRSNYDLWNLGTRADPGHMPWPTMLGDNAHQSRYAPPPALLSVSPRYVISNETSELTIHGDSFLKGMRVLLGTNQQPVISETVTSITFSVTANFAPAWYGVTVSNMNSSSATLSNAVVAITSAAGDDDGDSLPNVWEAQFGLDPLDDGSFDPANGAAGDPDNDKGPNWQELLAGTDPRDPASVFAIVKAERSAEGAVTLFWPSVAGRHYDVYRSTNLSSGFSILTNVLSATPPTNSFTDTTTFGFGTWFYRLRLR